MASLHDVTGHYLALQTALEGDEIGDDALAQEALASIGEAEDALERKQLGCALVVRNLDGEIDQLAEEIDRLTKRKKSREASREWLTRQMLVSMTLANVTKIKGPTLTVAVVANPPKVVVLDEAAIPERFMVTPEPPPPPKPRPDKVAILAAFKLTKKDVPGTRVEREERLAIK